MKTLQTQLFALVLLSLMASCQSTPKNDSTANVAVENDLFTAYFEHYPNVLTVDSRSENATPAEVKQIMKLYIDGQYQEALTQINQYLTVHPGEIDLKFYRGLILLELGKRDEAEADLSEVAATSENFSAQGKWYLALSYLKIKDENQASIFLNELASTANPFRQKAKDLLSKINPQPTMVDRFYQVTADNRYFFYYWKEQDPLQRPITERTFFLETKSRQILPDTLSYWTFVKLSPQEKKNLLVQGQTGTIQAMKQDYLAEIDIREGFSTMNDMEAKNP